MLRALSSLNTCAQGSSAARAFKVEAQLRAPRWTSGAPPPNFVLRSRAKRVGEKKNHCWAPPYLAEDEEVEDDGEVLAAASRHALKQCVAVEEEDEAEAELEGGLDEHVAPHDAADEACVALVGLSAEEVGSGELGAEGEGAHGVHDEVHPEHHHRVKGRLRAQEGGRKGGDQGHNVDSELELEELADIVEHAAAPHHRFDDGAEVVVHDDDVRGLLGHIGAAEAHGQPHLRRAKRRAVVGAWGAVTKR